MKIDEILKILPHRYPMLLVDRILSVEGKVVTGYKNVTINEAFFVGHYPQFPVMPGVLILESLAQVGAVLMLSDASLEGKIPLLGAMDNVKFKRPVVPGDQLVSTVELLWFRGGVGKMHGTCTVDGEVVATADMVFKLVDSLTEN